MAQTNLTIRFLAAKDGSFDQVANAVQERIQEIKAKGLLPEAKAEDSKALQEATEMLRKMREELTQVQAKAAATAAELAKLRSNPGTPGGSGGSSAPSSGNTPRKSIPDEVANSAKRASEALAEMQAKLQTVGKVGSGQERVSALQSGAIDLAKWRLENSQLISAVPQLKQQYSAVQAEIRIASSEALRLAAAEATAEAEAKKIAAAQKQVTADAEKARAKAIEGLRTMADLGRTAGLAVGGVGASMLGLAALVAKTAGGFEQLQARLLGVIKSGDQAQQTFQQAVQFAAVTPFSVSGIVQASITLSAFQQNVRKTLPLVADLAAGLGDDITVEAERFAKALSGSAEGYESFRNQAGISNADLRRYGATLTSTGSLALLTAGDVAKAAKALQTLVQIRFGGAAERQAKTLQGALSNLGDALERAGAAFGQYLIPIARVGAQQITGFVEALERLPAGFKATIAFGTVAAGTLATLGGGALFAGSQLLNLGLQLVELKGKLPEQAVAALTQRFGGLVSTAGRMVNSGLGKFFLAATGTVAGFAIAAEAADVACKLWLEHLAQLDREVVESAKSMHDAMRSGKQYAELINKISHRELITDLSGAKTATTQLAAAMKGVPLPQLVGGLQKAGVSLKDVKRDLEENEAQTKAFADRRKQLEELIKGKSDTRVTGNGQFAQVIDNSVDIPENLRGFFDGRTTVSIKEAKEELKKFGVALKDLEGGAVVLKGVEKAFESFASPLDAAVEKSKLLDNYLQFGGKTKDLLSLRDNLKLIDKDLENFKAQAKQAQLPTTEAGALDRLKVAQGGEVTFQQSFLKRLQERRDAQAALAAYEKELADEKLVALDRQHAREVADSDATLDSKKSDLQAERAYLDQRLTLVKGAVGEEIALTARLNTLLQQKPTHAREAAIESVRERLKAVRELADEETKTTQNVRDNEKAQLALRVSDAKNALEEQTRASLEFIKKEKANGAASPDLIKAYDRIILRLQAWREAHGPLLKQSHELRSAIQGVESQVNAGSREEKANKGKEVLQTGKAQLDEALATETNLREKQLLLANALQGIEDNIARGTYTRKQAESEINQLKKQQAELGRQIEQQDIKDAKERSGITKTGYDEELAILEQRKNAGQNVEFQLANLRRLRFQESLNQIALEAEAERRAGTDKEQIAFKTNAAVQSLLRQELQDKLNKYAEEEKAAEEHQRKLDDLRNNRIGGRNSPIQSAEEAFANGFLGDFSLDTPMKKQRKKAPTALDVAGQLGLSAELYKTFQDSTLGPLYNQRNLSQVGLPKDIQELIAQSKRGPDIKRVDLANEINQTERAKKTADEEKRRLSGDGEGPRNTQQYNATVNGALISASDSNFKNAVLTVVKAAFGESVNRSG
ncbi:MAG: hypothetical protein U0931_05000 [Vulcanimicrobiota bacterium]